MIKQNIEKIAKLLKDRSYSVPQLLYKFYTFFVYFAHKIDSQGVEFNAVSLFSQIYKIYKSYLVDQPYKLTKLGLLKIEQDFQNKNMESMQDLIKIRNIFLKQFPNLKPKQPYLKDIIEDVSNLSWTTKIKPYFIESLQIQKSIDSKKKVETIKYSQLAILCWYRKFQGDYLVHIQKFIEYFHIISKEIIPFLNFINKYSNHYLKELCDPDKKYYITIMNCQDLLFKLRDQMVVKRLWEETQQKRLEQVYQSITMLGLSLISSTLNTVEKINLNGENLKINNQQKPVKFKPVIFVGSAADNDIVIKSKYVSRKQVMIIEDKKGDKNKQYDHFSVVCLSQTNFTAVKYPKNFKIHIGDIFYCQNIKYQVVKLQKQSIDYDVQQQDERTLTILPTQRQSATNTSLYCERIIFLILSGEDKQKQLSISSQHLKKYTQMDKHQYNLSKQLIYDEHFYLKSGVKILLKNANQILENRLSRKIRLIKGMQICLEEYSLIIQ